MPFISEKLTSVASPSDSFAQGTSSGSGIVRSHFSTHGKSVNKQMLAWRERVGHVVDVLPSQAQIDNGFHGSIDRYTVGELIFTDARTDATILERSLARISTDRRRDYVFHIYKEGSVGNVTGIRKKRSEHAPPVKRRRRGRDGDEDDLTS